MSFPSLVSRIIKTELVAWQSFKFIQRESFKDWSLEAKAKLKKSILENQFAQPFYVWFNPSDQEIYCLDGMHRVLILQEFISEGISVPGLLPATFIECLDKKDAARLVLTYSSIYARVTTDGMFDFMKEYELNYDQLKMTIDLPEFDNMVFESMLGEREEFQPVIPKSLAERFIVPPFSVLDTRQGYWQDRKKAWHELGFDSQETREDIELIAKSGQAPAIYELRNKLRDTLRRDPSWDEIIEQANKRGLHIYSGASIFDPVLAEVCYTWFCPPGGSVLDPFAGGSVRGIVAAILGCTYHGIDLRTEQVTANKAQAEALGIEKAEWFAADSQSMDIILREDFAADFLFSCPPYHDLEKYSDDPNDLSNMDYEQFLKVYRSIIAAGVRRLKSNRFACFVVGDIRAKDGSYRDFVGDTIQAFRDHGLMYYNEIILINVAGSLAIRVGRQFEAGRKVGKMHQNVLVFYKGDPKKIKEEFPEINIVEDLQALNYQPNIALSVVDD